MLRAWHRLGGARTATMQIPEQTRRARRWGALFAAYTVWRLRELALRPEAERSPPNLRDFPAPEPETLRVLTLNVAHGRRHLPHQALLRRSTLAANLETIGSTLGHCSPDIVALQEADGPSSWSGQLDHVATLAEHAGLSDHFRGDHNPFRLGPLELASGTALLARMPLLDPASEPFKATWRDTKGFVVARVAVPAFGGEEIDVVSVHLDFLARRVRSRQIRRMLDVLADRQRPRVILGDLNCCYELEPRSLRLLTAALGVRAHAPERTVPTYPAHRPHRRLDWILVSRELEFAHYRNLPARLSDHLGVVADLRLRR